jgi:transitional endoplasmic reticulum ATPase
VIQSYAREIEKAASFLRAGLPVLVYCDKLVVGPVWRETVRMSCLEHQLLDVPDERDDSPFPRGMRQRQMARLKDLIRNLKKGQVLVIPHLDLLAGGSDSNLPTESRELIELIYEEGDRLVLAFADRSLEIPEVLAARFAVRLLITGVSRTVVTPKGERPIGEALVTAKEAACFRDYDPEGLYKNVAGMNPIRLRHAIRYAIEEYAEPEPIPVARLYEAIRAFKAQISAKFEVPNVSFQDIGGYEDVKAELQQAIHLMLGGYAIEERLRSELIPRGFIFYGPPGTGKTLFAKAVANKMNATIQVVSGPEVTDMYVGESERKVRELFAEARRNAPAVLVFDEFDSIATRRSGRDDGGSRAGNALVAQILTEMDGFRPDVPLLVIGTTNRIDIIDDALLRPSRFKAVKIGLPDPVARRAIAAVHARHFQVDVTPAMLEVIADATNAMNGDEIRSIFRDACVAEKLHRVRPDAHSLGRLVGQIRRAAQEKEASKSSQQSSPAPQGRTDAPPSPAGPMSPLTRSRPAAPAAPSPATAAQPDHVTERAESPGGPP